MTIEIVLAIITVYNNGSNDSIVVISTIVIVIGIVIVAVTLTVTVIILVELVVRVVAIVVAVSTYSPSGSTHLYPPKTCVSRARFNS